MSAVRQTERKKTQAKKKKNKKTHSMLENAWSKKRKGETFEMVSYDFSFVSISKCVSFLLNDRMQCEIHSHAHNLVTNCTHSIYAYMHSANIPVNNKCAI